MELSIRILMEFLPDPRTLIEDAHDREREQKKLEEEAKKLEEKRIVEEAERVIRREKRK